MPDLRTPIRGSGPILTSVAAPDRMHRINAAAPPAVDRIALDLRACRAIAHAAFQVAEVADLELDEPRPLIDAEAREQPRTWPHPISVAGCLLIGSSPVWVR